MKSAVKSVEVISIVRGKRRARDSVHFSGRCCSGQWQYAHHHRPPPPPLFSQCNDFGLALVLFTSPAPVDCALDEHIVMSSPPPPSLSLSFPGLFHKREMTTTLLPVEKRRERDLFYRRRRSWEPA